MLHAAYLQANQAWAVVLPSGELCGIGASNQHLFTSKKELKDALERCCLCLCENQVVTLD